MAFTILAVVLMIVVLAMLFAVVIMLVALVTGVPVVLARTLGKGGLLTAAIFSVLGLGFLFALSSVQVYQGQESRYADADLGEQQSDLAAATHQEDTEGEAPMGDMPIREPAVRYALYSNFAIVWSIILALVVLGVLTLLGNPVAKRVVLGGIALLGLLGFGWFALRVDFAVQPGRGPTREVEAAQTTPGENPTPQPATRALHAYAMLISDQIILSDRARPDWADQAPGLKQGVYRCPIKSGLYSTQEECRQALAAAAAKAVVDYGKIYLGPDSSLDISQLPSNWLDQRVPFSDAADNYQFQDGKSHFNANGADIARLRERAQREAIKLGQLVPGAKPPDFPIVTRTGHARLIEQPIFAETVDSSVGPMQQLYALLEFGDYTRAQLRDALRQAAIPHRVTLAVSGFAGMLAIVGVVLAWLRYDRAKQGRHRRLVGTGATLAILLIAVYFCRLCFGFLV